MNALDPAMFTSLISTGRDLIGRTDVRAVVLSGEGRAFSVGLDFEQFKMMDQYEAADLIPEVEPLGLARAVGQQAVHVWSLVRAPVVAAIHGAAFGGGLQLALGADMRVVAPTAHLSVMEVRWGLIPDMGGTQLLPELVGRDVAKDLALTGRTITGAEALTLGLATRLADDAVAGALDLAREIADHNADATRHIKALMDLAGRVDLEAGLAAEQKAIRKLIGSAEQRATVTRRLAELDKIEAGPNPSRVARSS